MSGALSRILNISGGVKSLANFISGNGDLQLGDFTFTGFAIPERISYGGSQSMAIHKLPGGTRVFDDMGSDDAPISWSGIFLGPDASAKAQRLDEMRKSGDEQFLSWGDYNFSVIIHQCTFSGEFYRIGYQISCEVQFDGPVNTDSPLAGLLGSDVANAISTAASAIQPALASAQTALGIAAQFGIGSPALGQVLGTLNAAGAVAGGVIAASGAVLAAVPASTTLLPNVSDVPAAQQASQDMAGSVIANGYIGRATQNVSSSIG